MLGNGGRFAELPGEHRERIGAWPSTVSRDVVAEATARWQAGWKLVMTLGVCRMKSPFPSNEFQRDDRLTIYPFLLLLLLSAALAGCATGVRPVVMDEATEKVLANAKTMDEGLAPARASGGELTTYVNAVGARLYDAARANHGGMDAIPNAVQVDLLINPTPLAFTFGGDHVYLSTGALALCAHEEDLAAALAHLYAHIVDQHRQSHDQLNSNDLLSVTYILARSPFTDTEEEAADKDGFKLFARGGWDPEKYAAAWTRLGGLDGPQRAASIARASGDAQTPDEWRKPTVADDFTFRHLIRTARAQTVRPEVISSVIMRSVQTCVGTDNPVSRAAAIGSLERLIPSGNGGGRS